MVKIFIRCILTYSQHINQAPQWCISKISMTCLQNSSIHSPLSPSLIHSLSLTHIHHISIHHVFFHTHAHTLSGVIPCSCWVCVNPISTFPDSGQGTLISLHPLITLCSPKWSISAPPRPRGPLQDYLLHLHTATQHTHTHTHTHQIRVLMWGKQGQPAFLADVKCGSRALATSLSATRFAWGRSEDAPVITDDSTARGWSPSFASTRAGGDSLLKAPPGKYVIEHSCHAKHMWMLCTYSFEASNPASDHTSKSTVLVSDANCKLCQLVS